MRILPTLLAVAILAFAGGSPALACRVAPNPYRVAGIDYDTIVLVTVQSAAYGETYGERPSWRAVGALRQTVVGDPGATPLAFGRSGISTACDDGQPLPPLGEVWVLYLRQRPDLGKQIVEQAQPLSLIGPVDPRLKALKTLPALP